MTLPSDYTLAHAYIAALTGDDPASAHMSFRCIHDKDAGVPAHSFDGTLAQHWQTFMTYQALGYGVFCNINALDGNGRHLENVAYIRAHPVDLDNSSAQQNYERLIATEPKPAFAVQSSPGKFHTYHLVNRYRDNDYYTTLQRRLRQVYDGDKSVIDPTRVLRLPGTVNLKYDVPHLVTCWLTGGTRIDVQTLADTLAHVNIMGGDAGIRVELGTPELAAPSFDWVRRALLLIDPNDLDRGEWLGISAAVKQAAWSHGTPDQVHALWSDWCSRYAKNDAAENLKLWDSVRSTELGWSTLVKRTPGLVPNMAFGGVDRSSQLPTANLSGDVPPMPVAEPPPLDCSGEMLTHIEQAVYFGGCTYVVNLGTMLCGDGRFLGVTQFNAAYGGKKFLVDSVGKSTNEAWTAATRSTLWTVPKVDHIRFIPNVAYNTIVVDELERKGINMFKPANIQRISGDPTPFLNHINHMLPNVDDQRILLDFLAHNVKFPGFKIPWAPVIQSTEGAGKGILKRVVSHAISRPYCYFPNAKELTNSGSQFNAWMRNKLFILADEIKVDDRLDLIEVLKPMISEEMIEIQAKGQNQEIEDNFSNWLFFTNYKNAIPVNKNGRRFCIMYSCLQTVEDLLARGLDDAYFATLYGWLDAGGAAIVADYLMNYPLERGAIPMRAPLSSSSNEAITISRSPIERTIIEAVEDGLQGFRGGWVSSISIANRLRLTGAVRGNVTPVLIGQIVEAMGYVACGRASRTHFGEDVNSRTYLWHIGAPASVEDYGAAQGW